MLDLLRRIHEAHFAGWSTMLLNLIEDEVSALLDEHGPASPLSTTPTGAPK